MTPTVEYYASLLAEQSQTIAEQSQTIALLTARISELEERLAVNSQNSNQPPSKDEPKKPARPKRPKSGKKVGGQPGHPGKTLFADRPPDEIVAHRATHCHACGESLSGAAVVSWKSRFVFELPPKIQLNLCEHRVVECRCPHCGAKNKGVFPPNVRAGVSYGERLNALATALRVEHSIPYERCAALLCTLFGQKISAGTLASATKRVGEAVAAPCAAILKEAQSAPVAGADETGLNVGGETYWAHTLSSPRATHLLLDKRRGAKAIEPHLADYAGTVVHDGWASYRKFDRCGHALCNAHHLRELTFLEEVQGQTWAGEIKSLLQQAWNEVKTAREKGANALSETVREAYVVRFRKWLACGRAAQPPPAEPPPGVRGRKRKSKASALLDRLEKWETEIWKFAADFTVPFDNNAAERDVRMLKVNQKVFGCWRTVAGAAAHLNLRSVILTWRKRGGNAFDGLTEIYARFRRRLPHFPILTIN